MEHHCGIETSRYSAKLILPLYADVCLPEVCMFSAVSLRAMPPEHHLLNIPGKRHTVFDLPRQTVHVQELVELNPLQTGSI